MFLFRCFLVIKKVQAFADKITICPYEYLYDFPDPIVIHEEIKFPEANK